MAGEERPALPPALQGEAGDYLRQLADAGQDCMWILSVDGRTRFANSRGRSLLQAAGGDAEDFPIVDVWPAESRASLARALAGAAGGQEQRFRTFFRDDQGGGAYWETLVSPVRSDGATVSELIAVSRDVTATVETQAFLETVIQLLPAPLTVKDANTRRYLVMNRAVEELMGIEGGEGIGRLAEEILPADRAARIRGADEAVLREGRMARLEHVTFPSVGDGPRYFNFKILATHDDAGPRHLVTIGDDVTERRAAAEKLQAALEAAEQASQAKSAFIANMSHELRTPLNGVLAGAELLAGETLSDRGRELAVMIRASGRALERLVTDILEIVRAERGELALDPAPFSIGEVLDQALDEVRPALALRGIGLRAALDPELTGAVTGDAGRLRQVLDQLLSNAAKFTERGRIEVRVNRTMGERVRFTVADTGIGFDPELGPRLFERFFQADESYTRRFEGSGLGLAISRELVTRMGGTITGEGRPGEGAAFWFEIPLPAVVPDRWETDAAGSGASLPELRILIADDHPTNRRVVQLMLGDLAQVVSAEDGAQAVDAFRAARFDAVLMDMQMPVMDGLAAVRAIRQLEAEACRPRTPIIMLTANALAEHRAASAAAGADLHLGKPITGQGLVAALQAALARPGEETDMAPQDADLYPAFVGGRAGSPA
ncbi:ATP-binding protein [Caulobacter sp. KR2-114]|uniref:PAS domain-containing hybrid sensor histidine kinase/response regulator n=1 Tax=Caulobacter sp. KR2-114 TaxID=3400912 RepID=UPI003C066BDF